MVHDCDQMPHAIIIESYGPDSEWTLSYGLFINDGYDEAVEANVSICTCITYCPWCGINLDEVARWPS